LFRVSNRVRSAALTAVLTGVLAGCATPHKTEAQQQADKATAARVQAALDADGNLFARHIIVRADDGVVRLSGYVWDPPDLNKAVRIASQVDGVTRVVNGLELQRNGMENSGVTR
jgi:osmotically-inducible protein OsmY